MCDVADVDLAGAEEAADVLLLSELRWPKHIATYLSTKAVPNSSNALYTQVLFHMLDGSLDNGVHDLSLVLWEPGGEIDLARLQGAEVDLVAVEQVGHDNQVSVRGELVGEELPVDIEAEDIGQKHDSLFGGLVVLGVDDVGVG